MPYNITSLVELPDGKRTTIYVSQQPKQRLNEEELKEVLKKEHRFIAFDKIIRQEALKTFS